MPSVTAPNSDLRPVQETTRASHAVDSRDSGLLGCSQHAEAL